MQSGDGLIVRVRPWCGAFTLAQARGVAEAAGRFGNALLDLTRRANLQIRGVSRETLPGLQAALAAIGAIDDDAESEAVRNVMVGPLAGAKARALAAGLSQALVAARDLHGLPAKFGWLVDDGAIPSIVDQRADIALCLMKDGVALRADDRWLGLVPRGQAIAAALALAAGGQPGMMPMGDVPKAVAVPMGIAAPFGRLEAAQLCGLVDLALQAGATEVRLAPWRSLYFDAPVEGADRLGLIVDGGDPLLRIEACPGAPACLSSTVDTRRDARRLAARPFEGTIHVSGCAKGCARTAPADLVLVGDRGRYGVIRGGTTRDRVEGYILPDEL
jgi:precorrin-3B synthase